MSMSEEKPSLDSSVPPEGHAFNIDLEKGLPLNTPQDIKESFGSGSPKIKRNKVVAFLVFLFPDKDYYDIKENKIKANAYTFLAEYKEETKRHFPKNVIFQNRTVHCISTLVLSLLCSLAAFYHYDFLSWLVHVSSKVGYAWDFFCPLGQFFLTWATSFGVFYVSSRPIIWVAWLVAKALIFIVGGLGVVSEHFLFPVQVFYPLFFFIFAVGSIVMLKLTLIFVVLVLVGFLDFSKLDFIFRCTLAVAVVTLEMLVAILLAKFLVNGIKSIFTGLGQTVGVVCWICYHSLICILGYSTEETSSLTLPKHQQKDDAFFSSLSIFKEEKN